MNVHPNRDSFGTCGESARESRVIAPGARPASSYFPRPKHPERLAMPRNYGLRLHNHQRRAPVCPTCGTAEPTTSVRSLQAQAFLCCALQYSDLMTECYIRPLQSTAALFQTRQPSNSDRQPTEYGWTHFTESVEVSSSQPLRHFREPQLVGNPSHHWHHRVTILNRMERALREHLNPITPTDSSAIGNKGPCSGV